MAEILMEPYSINKTFRASESILDSITESNLSESAESNRGSLFLTNLAVDYNSEPSHSRINSLRTQESIKSEISFKNNTIFSWEQISVRNKKQTNLFDIFKRSKDQKSTEINKEFVNSNLKFKNASVIDNYLILNRSTLETQSNQSGSSSSKHSYSLEVSNKHDRTKRNILENGYLDSKEFERIFF